MQCRSVVTFCIRLKISTSRDPNPGPWPMRPQTDYRVWQPTGWKKRFFETRELENKIWISNLFLAKWSDLRNGSEILRLNLFLKDCHPVENKSSLKIFPQEWNFAAKRLKMELFQYLNLKIHTFIWLVVLILASYCCFLTSDYIVSLKLFTMKSFVDGAAVFLPAPVSFKRFQLLDLMVTGSHPDRLSLKMLVLLGLIPIHCRTKFPSKS